MAHTATPDIVVVGAGPAGSSLALLMARAGANVLLLDKARFPRDKTCGGGLTPRAMAVLERFGLLEAVESIAAQRVTGAHLRSPSGHVWRMEFDEIDSGLPPFGLIVPRYKLDEFLVEQAVAAGASFRPGAGVTDLMMEGRRVVGVTARHDGRREEILAPLTAIATGASISLLKRLRLLQRMPPVILAARGYYSGVTGLEGSLEFYFEGDMLPGYAWVFPMGDGRANVGMGMFPKGQRGSPRQMLEDFVRSGPAADRFRGARLDGRIKGYPLRTDYPLYDACGDGFILLGESMGLVNPVSGEGIDLALESAEIAAPVALSALERGNTGARSLKEYDRRLRRRFEGYFRGMRILRDRAMAPGVLDSLILRSARDPALARTVTGINLGVVSPWVVIKKPGLAWRVLRYLAHRAFK